MTKTPLITFAEFEFNAASGELRRGAENVRLEPQPARVLALLVERAGDVVTRTELQQGVWGGDTCVDFERGLNYCIAQIRTALGDSASTPRFIETLPRRGYRFLRCISGHTGSNHRCQTRRRWTGRSRRPSREPSGAGCCSPEWEDWRPPRAGR